MVIEDRKKIIERRQQKRLDDFNRSIPTIYRDFFKEKYPRPELAKKILSEWQAGDEKLNDSPFDSDVTGLILFGSPRSGKTQLACELARQKIISEHHADARFISAVQWAAETTSKAKNCELDNWTHQCVKFARAYEVDPAIVIIDDLDKIRVSPSVQSELFNLIENITANGLWLVVTTNVSSRELADKFAPEFGSAIIARLQEFCVPVNFDKK